MTDNIDNKGSFPPWSRIPSLKEMTAEAGIDFDQFIQFIEEGKDINEMAEYFQANPSTISLLQKHFYKYGISSVLGGD